jgi:hypothetical protein
MMTDFGLRLNCSWEEALRLTTGALERRGLQVARNLASSAASASVATWDTPA